jgi:hypothetical protein
MIDARVAGMREAFDGSVGYVSRAASASNRAVMASTRATKSRAS